MKTQFISSCLLVGCIAIIQMKPTALYAQQSPLSKVFQDTEEKRKELWEARSFEKAVELLKATIEVYNNASEAERGLNKLNFELIFYRLACAYSVLNLPDSALRYLRKYYDLAFGTYSTYYRSANFYSITRNKDFDNLKNNEGFRELLLKFKEVNWEDILKEYSSYKPIESKLTSFVYINDDGDYLPDLKAKYHLDSVAGNGDEISRILNLMRWVHNTVPYDGNSGEPVDRHADALLELSKKENKGLNCWMLSTILNEVYLAMGFKSRFVSCYPKGDPAITHEWHVIVEVFSTTLNKWLWMDPTSDTYVKDEKGNFLSIAEVRERLIKDLPVYASPDINVNGEKEDGEGEKYLHDYMMKNLFRISIPLVSIPGYEMAPLLVRYYVELLPDGYNPRNVKFHEVVGRYSNRIYTTDDKQFWAPPTESK